MDWQHGILDLRVINGDYHIWTSGYRNHQQIGLFSPIEFFKYVATQAPGSYGILYVRDDEDMVDDNDNKFKVYVLAHGQLTEREDPFLSPFVPQSEFSDGLDFLRRGVTKKRKAYYYLMPQRHRTVRSEFVIITSRPRRIS